MTKKTPTKKTSTRTTSSRDGWTFTAGENHGGLYSPADRWAREDGAVVKYSKDYYWANPVKEGHRGWIAFGPKDDHALFYTLRGSRAKIHRRWKTAQAAMAYIDEMYPVGTACGDLARGHPGDVGTVGIPG